MGTLHEVGNGIKSTLINVSVNLKKRYSSLESCMYIQYISYVITRELDMSDKKQVFQQALELIIDGVALSTEAESRAQVGAYLMGLVVADNQGNLDSDKVEAIKMIIQMADEADSPEFKL